MTNAPALSPVLRIGLPVAAVGTWIGTLIWIGARIGVGGIAAGLALSIIIGGLVVLAILWLDRGRAQRRGLLVSAFLYGATFTTLAGIGLQALLQVIVEGLWGVDAGVWIRPLLIAPLTEDGLKGLFLIWMLIAMRRQLTGVLDGIVFGALVGAGFTFTENILYFGDMVNTLIASSAAGDPNAIADFAFIFTLRGIIVPFFHPLMGALIGIGVALAAHRTRPAARVGLVALGYLAAMLIHGLWDWAAIASAQPEPYVAAVLLLVLLPAIIATAVVAIVLRRRRGLLLDAPPPPAADDITARGDVRAERSTR
ncbi:PrsW family intramembrane metalloprotease [Microbacterium sp. EST19A]|uniref:PrsW family intramembrane metalloprotease n=1 Tax=Microbacterium sp. EST19A TaxID=2862681 RepID=UPI001CBAA3B3|nr:PrsW family intramembrane metalloprotease [Microbacterium sp. EST19A]